MRVFPGTLSKLLLGLCCGADVVCAPYAVRWTTGGPREVLGYRGRTGDRIGPPIWWLPYHGCLAGGMGCTALRLRGAWLPDRFTVASALGVRGEDIGFFDAARTHGATVWLGAPFARTPSRPGPPRARGCAT